VSACGSRDVEFSDADRAELLATVEESTDRLTAVVDNLLALSRLPRRGAVRRPRPAALDAVRGTGRPRRRQPGAETVELDVPEDLPAALADAGLLERVPGQPDRQTPAR
jgi:two-component system sensor histidine kinase KdpD